MVDSFAGNCCSPRRCVSTVAGSGCWQCLKDWRSVTLPGFGGEGARSGSSGRGDLRTRGKEKLTRWASGAAEYRRPAGFQRRILWGVGAEEAGRINMQITRAGILFGHQQRSGRFALAALAGLSGCAVNQAAFAQSGGPTIPLSAAAQVGEAE